MAALSHVGFSAQGSRPVEVIVRRHVRSGESHRKRVTYPGASGELDSPVLVIAAGFYGKTMQPAEERSRRGRDLPDPCAFDFERARLGCRVDPNDVMGLQRADGIPHTVVREGGSDDKHDDAGLGFGGGRTCRVEKELLEDVHLVRRRRVYGWTHPEADVVEEGIGGSAPAIASACGK